MVIKEFINPLEKKFFDLCSQVVTGEGLSLYDVEWTPGSQVLTVFIYDKNTNSAVIEDCIKIDRALSPYIDSENWMPENLTLEVSSPGLFRHLNQVEHFKMADGQEVQLTLFKKIDSDHIPDFPKAFKNSTKFKAKLLNAANEKITIELKGIKLDINYNDIKRANLETDISSKKES